MILGAAAFSCGSHSREVDTLIFVFNVRMASNFFILVVHMLKGYYRPAGQSPSVKGKGKLHRTFCFFCSKGLLCNYRLSICLQFLTGRLIHQGSLYRVFLTRDQSLIGNSIYNGHFLIRVTAMVSCFLVQGCSADPGDIDGLPFICDVFMLCNAGFCLEQLLKYHQSMACQGRSVKCKSHICRSGGFFWFKGRLSRYFLSPDFYRLPGFFIHQDTFQNVLCPRSQVPVGNRVY